MNPLNDKPHTVPQSGTTSGTNTTYTRPQNYPANSNNTMLTHRDNHIRVILADSQAIFRVGMSKVFAAEPDIHVIAQADSLPNLLMSSCSTGTSSAAMESSSRS
jgi:hypothetical protein